MRNTVAVVILCEHLIDIFSLQLQSFLAFVSQLNLNLSPLHLIINLSHFLFSRLYNIWKSNEARALAPEAQKASIVCL